MNLIKLPIVKLFIPFLIGILINTAIPFNGKIAGIVSIPLVVFLIISWIYKKHAYGNVMFTVSVIGIFGLMGIYLSYQAQIVTKPNLVFERNLSGVYLVKIEETPKERKLTNKLKVNVILKLESDGKNIPVKAKALLYLTKKYRTPQVGDICLVKTKFSELPGPENTHQFNYKTFLANQGILYQAFVKSGRNFYNTGINRSTISQKITQVGGTYLKNLFKKTIHDSIALGVTEALIFGYKDDLSQEIVKAYSSTGTLHILAVSGLHVALVFFILNKILWFFDRCRHGVWIKTVLVLFFIWSYCLITGMAPSIIRAGVMISIIVIGNALKRKPQLFNTLALSGFILLFYNPRWLMDIGFQLSFLAVIGIVTLQNFIGAIWVPKSYLLKKVWEIMAISLCAQLATFPITLYYFNQFPVYFLLSNVLIIPLSTLVIYGGVGMLLCSTCGILLVYISTFTEILVKISNYLVLQIEQLPFAVLDGIKISVPQVILIYICIVFFINWAIHKKRGNFIYAMVLVCISFTLSSYDKYKQQQFSGIVIFNVPNCNTILVTNGKKSLILTDGESIDQQSYYIKGWLVQHRLWPLDEVENLEESINKGLINKPLNLTLKNGVLSFKKMTINFNPNFFNQEWVTYNYFLPKKYLWKEKYEGIIYSKLFIGHENSKRLQKKLHFFSKKLHKNVRNVKKIDETIELKN